VDIPIENGGSFHTYVLCKRLPEGIFGVVKKPSNGAFVAAIPNHDGGMRREASHLSPCPSRADLLHRSNELSIVLFLFDGFLASRKTLK